MLSFMYHPPHASSIQVAFHFRERDFVTRKVGLGDQSFIIFRECRVFI